jgi:hypothetical protein
VGTDNIRLSDAGESARRLQGISVVDHLGHVSLSGTRTFWAAVAVGALIASSWLGRPRSSAQGVESTEVQRETGTPRTGGTLSVFASLA